MQVVSAFGQNLQNLGGEWFFAVRPMRSDPGTFVAWAAQTRQLGEGPLFVDPRLSVYFEFGTTANEAVNKLKRDLAS